MVNFTVPLIQIQTFILIFLRVSAITMSIPIFSQKSIPLLFKAGLAFSLSIILLPSIKLENIHYFNEIIPFGIEVIQEIMLGIIIGLSVRLIFTGIQLAGQIIGFQMGFAIANILDPLTSDQLPIIAQFYNLIALMIFLTINAHHWLFRALVESFRLIPPFTFHLDNSFVTHLMSLTSYMFIIAIKIAAPVMVVLLLTSVAFGLIARTVPQMNVFVVAMPLKILIGLLFIIFTLPIFARVLNEIFIKVGTDIILILKGI